MIYFEESHDNIGIEPYQKENIEKVINRTAEKFGEKFQVNVFFITDEEIREINLEQRGLDKATDVLSFPMCDIPNDEIERDPETGDIVLGDILVSVEHCAEQAKQYGHAFTREICFLIAHGMLHLLGYDHMTEDEAAVMYAKQDEILEDLKITREKTEGEYEI